MNEDKKGKKDDAPGFDPITGVYQTYRAEFRRIVWPSNPVLFKHTITVIVVALLFGAYIAVLDTAFGFGLQRFIAFFV
jgi:preprotein translocase SecE subunit